MKSSEKDELIVQMLKQVWHYLAGGKVFKNKRDSGFKGERVTVKDRSLVRTH